MLRKLLVRPLKRKIKGFVGETVASGWGMLALPSSTYPACKATMNAG